MAFELSSRPAVQPRLGSRVVRATGAAVQWAEAHPILATLVAALAARTVVAIGVFVLRDGSLFPDDRTYTRLATQAAAGDSGEWNSFEQNIFDKTIAYSGTLSVLYWIFGSSAIVGQLFTAVLGALTAAAVAALGLHLLPRRGALLVGLAVAVFPSQVLWSSLTLKDAAVWASLAGMAVAVHAATKADSARAVVVSCSAAVVGLLILGHLRLHTTVIATWALVLTTLVVTACHRVVLRGAFFAAAIVIPLVVGIGPLGYNFVSDNVDTLADRRAENAYGAESALVRPSTPKPPRLHGLDDEDDLSVNLRYLPHGLAAVLVRPTPWSSRRTLGLTFASAESLLWYPVLALAAIGILTAWRRRDVLAFPVIVAAGIILQYALSEGNLGTAYRHRGEVVWVALLLAAVGVARLIEWRPLWAARRAEHRAA